MQSQNSVDIAQKDTLIRNSFFLWSHALILLLTAIPVFSNMESFLFHGSQWTVPKIYELKMYAIAMFISLILPILGRYVPSLLFRDHPRYQFFFLIFYPCSVFIYSLSFTDSIRYFSVFAFALLGVLILIFDLCNLKMIKKSYLNQNYNNFLITAILLSIFIIVCKSDSNIFNLISGLSIAIFTSIFMILRFINIHNRYFFLFVPVLIFIITFGSMQGAMEVTHYSFFLGPVIEVIYGHVHPLTIDIQYGGGLTLFLALYFKIRGLVSFSNLQELLKFLTFMDYLIIYLLATSLYRSQKIAFLTLLTIFCFAFFAPNMKYYYCAPSIGFLRFGLIYPILLCYALENRLFSSKFVMFTTSILGSIAVFWSFESAVYTLPALFFSEYINKSLRKFVPVFLGFFCFISLLYFSPLFFQGKLPTLWRYNEYAMLYANGFGQLPLNRLISFWWLFPLLYGFFSIKIITGDISNKLISALTVYGICTFTYFAGRAHPINLLVVSIPFILLSQYLILNIKSISLFIQQILISLACVIFSSAYYVIDKQHTILQGIWKVNLPLMKNFLLLKGNPPFLISDKDSLSLSEKSCSIKSPLKKYVENDSIAILSLDQKTLLNFYACTKSHNALSINPYLQTAINPKAVERTIQKAHTLKNRYILVEANLAINDPWNTDMPRRILQKLNAKKIAELIVEGKKIVIFERNSKKEK